MASGRHSTPGGRRSRGGSNERHPRPGGGGKPRPPVSRDRHARGGAHAFPPRCAGACGKGVGHTKGGRSRGGRASPPAAPVGRAGAGRAGRLFLPPGNGGATEPRARRAGHSPTTRQREPPSAPEDLPGSGRPRERRQQASSPRPCPRRGKESASCPLRRRRGAGATCRGGGERQRPRGLLGKPMGELLQLQENVAKVFILSPEGVRGALPSAVLVRGCRRCVPFLW